ncbi:DUF3048 domain-containing protein [Patescibacteria group bacterium]|nr:MAG: DUF3048 domain-containing protein [Patescibacteria group bacterium]
MTNYRQELERWFQKLKTKEGYASAMAIALAFALVLGLYAFRGVIWPDRPDAPDEAREEVLAFRHPLTGERRLEPMEDYPLAYAVMVDHSVDAWPQSGVNKAFLVIEAPVEAGIPRLEAFFAAGTDVGKIGPVRSARPYFVDWAQELDALYAHVGGSDAALELIGRTGVFDLNEFGNGAAYWRSADRFAPHNAYTSSERLAAAAKKAEDLGKAPTLLYGTWAFKDIEPEPEGAGATVDFGATSYKADWTYDPKTGTYARRQGGLPYQMQDGSPVAAANVAIVITQMKVVDAVGRREVKTVGEGSAMVLQDGKAVKGTWKKPSATERIRFFDENGAEMEMNAGLTWIEVVPDAEMVSIHEPAEAPSF